MSRAESRRPPDASSREVNEPRVREARHDDAAVLGPRAMHEGQLAVVEHAHGGHETDAVAGDPTLEDGLAQLVGVVDDDHERRRRRPPGALPSVLRAVR